jgi:WD40 repeat protein
MNNYKIITLGTSGAGKTVFLGSLFKQLSIQGEKGFFIEVADSEKRKELITIYTKVISGEKWPSGTRKLTDWTFNCCVKNSDLDIYSVCQFTYIDYAGGLLTDTGEDEDIPFDFQEEVVKADAVLAIIDGLKVYKFMRDSSQGPSNPEVTIFLQRDLPKIMLLVDKCKKIPVHFIISKWDLLDSHYNLSEVKERLLTNFPDFNSVVRSRVKAGCPVRLIPISSIGKEFATLQSDGSMKKNPDAIPTPFQVEVPLACVLIDRVRAYMNTSGRDKQDIQESVQAKNNFGFLSTLIQSFFNREAEMLLPNKEERLKEVKNDGTALNYLIDIFCDRLQKFEKDFPEANLGGEILFPLSNATLIHTLVGHQKLVRSVGFTSDSQIIFSASHDKSIRYWQVASGKPQGIVYEKAGFVLANLSKNNQLLFTTSEDNSIKIWDANTRKILHKWNAHSDLINAFVVSPDGHTLISGSRDKTVKVWQLQTNSGKLIHTLIGHQGFVYALAVSSDWRIAASGSSDKTVFLWELDSGKLLHSLDKHPGFVRALAFSPDGKKLVSGGFDKTVYVWDWKARKLQYKLEEHTGAILSLAISSDNRILASGSEDCTIKLWDLSTGTLVTTLSGHRGRVTALAFSPDNQTLASGSEDNTIKTWKLV